MNLVGYVCDYLCYCYFYFVMVICDNLCYLQIWLCEFGVFVLLFMVILFFYDGFIFMFFIMLIFVFDVGRVLWVGCLDRQKCLDLLVVIVVVMFFVYFDVYGVLVMFGVVVQGLDLLRFLQNVILYGEFKCFEEVVILQYFVYLYIIVWEGIFIILFDVVVVCLLICVLVVGGIVDFFFELDLVLNLEDIVGFV